MTKQAIKQAVYNRIELKSLLKYTVRTPVTKDANFRFPDAQTNKIHQV